jgi:DNA-binding MarR family transcriptional regulator
LVSGSRRPEVRERREADATDGSIDDVNRVYLLRLTPAGLAAFEDIRRIAEEHQRVICAALTDAEREKLAAFLQRIAEERELGVGVHPGYRWLGRRVRSDE